MDPEALDALRRGTGLSLSAEGVFELHGRPLENPRVVALFHRGVGLDGAGEVTLTVGARWCYLPCAGVARFIEALRFEEGGVAARMLGGEERDLDGVVVGYAPDDRLYAWVADLDGPALLLRAAHQTLLPRVADDLTLDLGTARGLFVRLDEVPGAADRRPADPDATGSDEAGGPLDVDPGGAGSI